MPVFTAWGGTHDDRPHTLVPGSDRPCFANGDPQPDCERLFWTIDAVDWDQAQKTYNAKQGWVPAS